jgi:hypothetical protein
MTINLLNPSELPLKPSAEMLIEVSPRTLLHACASRLGRSGAGDRAPQALGRWKEPKMIRRYVHLSEEYLREAVAKIANNSPTLFTANLMLRSHLSIDVFCGHMRTTPTPAQID